jgi:flagellar protein FlgJ
MTIALTSTQHSSQGASTDLPEANAATTSAANNYSDLKGLAALNADSHSPQTLHAVAQQVDALFLQMMLQSMREASADAGDPSNNEMGMYQDMFDKQVALTMSQHQDLGLGSMLTRRIAASSSATPAAAVSSAPGAGAPRGSAATGSPPTVGAATGARSASAIAKSPADFVAQVLPAIRVAANALGVSPLGMLAQAALETGWGQRVPTTADGNSSLNLFGVKAGENWTGGRAGAATVEFSGGVATPRRAVFRTYGSVQQSVSDFATVLGSPRYRDAVAGGADARSYIDGIGKSGYATDPEYAEKLSKVLNSMTFLQAIAGSGIKL